ncbi:MAG: shikimate kinase [Microbacteriaceae bacterium]
MDSLKPWVVFIGAPGAGKSKIGKRVAKILGVEFIDTDKRIVASHGPISAIFANDGETYFRALEKAEVGRALTKSAVVSFGGGAVVDEDTQAALRGHRVVYLTITPEAVESRLTGDSRPLLAGGIADWVALVAARTPVYECLATLTVDTSTTSPDSIAAEIAAWVTKDRQ